MATMRLEFTMSRLTLQTRSPGEFIARWAGTKRTPHGRHIRRRKSSRTPSASTTWSCRSDETCNRCVSSLRYLDRCSLHGPPAAWKLSVVLAWLHKRSATETSSASKSELDRGCFLHSHTTEISASCAEASDRSQVPLGLSTLDARECGVAWAAR